MIILVYADNNFLIKQENMLKNMYFFLACYRNICAYYVKTALGFFWFFFSFFFRGTRTAHAFSC